MTVEIIRPQQIAAPQPDALRGSLLQTATVVEGYRWTDPNDVFESLNCLTTRTYDTTCDQVTNATKTFDGPTWVDGKKVAAYMGVKCDPIGRGNDLETMLRSVYANVESRAVEQAFIGDYLSTMAAGLDITPTPGTAVSPEYGMALLEGDAGKKYAGAPTLHLPRAMASYLGRHNGEFDWDGNVLRTKLGSKVVAGGGYDIANQGPNNVNPGAGEFWLWATGEVLVVKGDLIDKSELNRLTNDGLHLIERAYILAVDCYVAAVLVKVT